jgi:hypothetical protein
MFEEEDAESCLRVPLIKYLILTEYLRRNSDQASEFSVSAAQIRNSSIASSERTGPLYTDRAGLPLDKSHYIRFLETQKTEIGIIFIGAFRSVGYAIFYPGGWNGTLDPPCYQPDWIAHNYSGVENLPLACDA